MVERGAEVAESVDGAAELLCPPPKQKPIRGHTEDWTR